MAQVVAIIVKTRTALYVVVNTMFADDLVTLGTMVSSAYGID